MGTQSFTGNDPIEFTAIETQANQLVVDVAVKYGDRATKRAIADIDPNAHYWIGAGATLTGSAVGMTLGIPTQSEAVFGLGGGILGAIAGFLILKILTRK